MTIEELLAATGLTANDLVPIWDAEAAQNVEPTQKITAAQFAAAVKVLASLVNTTEMNAAIQQSTALLNTIEDHQITRIGSYINERANFKARRVGGTVIILSYVQVTAEIPAGTQFANIGFGNAEGIFAFVSGGVSRIVSCSVGKLAPDAALPAGYYYAVGSALAPHT